MVRKKIVWNILSVLVIAAVLAGCGAAPTVTIPTPTNVPTVDPKPTFDAVSTQAAQTVVANLTLNAPSATPVVPTATSAPTNTPAPSNTPAPTATTTRVFIPWTKTPTPTQAAFGCTVTNVKPTVSLKVNQDFDAEWTITNSGVKTWSSGNVDIKYVSGTRLQTGGDAVDLGHDVAPNGTYTVIVDMKAPASDGSYQTSWGIYLEDGTVCSLNLSINVTN